MSYLRKLALEIIPFSVKTAIVFVAGLILVLLGITFLVNRSTDSVINRERILNAEGVAKRKVKPDSARVSLGKTLRGKDAVTLQNEAAQSINNLINELKKLDIKDEQMSTNNYYVTPSYDSFGKTISEYQVSISLQVNLEKTNPSSDLLNKILNAGKTANVTDVGGLYFYLADQDKISRELEDEAIADAKAVAEKRAQSAGLRLGKVLNVGNGNSVAPYPPMDVSGGRGVSSEGSTGGLNIKPGQVDLEYRVTLSYELL